MKKGLLFLLFVSIVSICFAESPDVSSGKGTVVPSKYDVETGTVIPSKYDVTTSKDIANKDEDSTPRKTTTSVQNISMTQTTTDEMTQVTESALQSIKDAFPNLTNFVSCGAVEKGSKIKVPSGAKYFIALVKGKWVSFQIPSGAEQFNVPVDSLLSYFAW